MPGVAGFDVDGVGDVEKLVDGVVRQVGRDDDDEDGQDAESDPRLRRPLVLGGLDREKQPGAGDEQADRRPAVGGDEDGEERDEAVRVAGRVHAGERERVKDGRHEAAEGRDERVEEEEKEDVHPDVEVPDDADERHDVEDDAQRAGDDEEAEKVEIHGRETERRGFESEPWDD